MLSGWLIISVNSVLLITNTTTTTITTAPNLHSHPVQILSIPNVSRFEFVFL